MTDYGDQELLAKMNREANIFAMHLLMPSPLLRKHMPKGLDLTDDKAIAALAAKFKVPASVMAIRLGMLIQERDE